MSSTDDGNMVTSLDAQHDKYVGLMLAVSSSLMIGISFVITKKGLIDSTARHGGHGSASDQYLFLKNPIWLLGMLTSNVFQLIFTLRSFLLLKETKKGSSALFLFYSREQQRDTQG